MTSLPSAFFRRVSWSSCAFQRLIYVGCEFVNFLWIFSFCIPGQSLVIFFSIDLKHDLLHLYVYVCPNPSRYCIIVVLWMQEKAIFLLKWFIMYASVCEFDPLLASGRRRHWVGCCLSNFRTIGLSQCALMWDVVIEWYFFWKAVTWALWSLCFLMDDTLE